MVIFVTKETGKISLQVISPSAGMLQQRKHWMSVQKQKVEGMVQGWCRKAYGKHRAGPLAKMHGKGRERGEGLGMLSGSGSLWP